MKMAVLVLLLMNIGCWKRLLRVPWTARRSNQVHPEGSQLWIFMGRTDAETPILWPLDVKNQLFGKDPDVGKDWGQEEKGVTEDEMVGWHHWFSGHEWEQTPGGREGQGSLVCCSSWGHKELDTTEYWTTSTRGKGMGNQASDRLEALASSLFFVTLTKLQSTFNIEVFLFVCLFVCFNMEIIYIWVQLGSKAKMD